MEIIGGELTSWFPKLVETQVDLIASTLSSLTSPLFSPPSTTTTTKPHPPSATTGGVSGNQLVRRVGYGVLGAAYAAMVLAAVMAVAVVMGVVVVNHWVEQPVFVREKLHFDYTDVNPEAVFVFRGGERKRVEVGGGVPVGHTFYVSVVLVVPDSDYNRELGVFQLMAEVVSTNGKITARSSQPSMLQYQSEPIRLMKTFIMGVPLLLGISHETQKITVPMLKYKEDTHLRTEAIKITLMPRAGTSYLPQLYEGEIVMHSRMPFVKELVYRWKWTFYVWTSLYIYIMLLLILVCFFKPLLVLPLSRALSVVDHRRETGDAVVEMEEKSKGNMPEEREFTETLRKWQQYRRKRKAELLSQSFMEKEDPVESTSASSYTVTNEDIGYGIMEEDVGDS